MSGQPMLATIENMRAHPRATGTAGLTAYSPVTDEQYSADPIDYWNVPDGWTMHDANGEPMILGSFVTTFTPVTS